MTYRNNINVDEVKSSFGNVVETAGAAASQVGKDVRKGAAEIGGAVKDASQQAAKELGKTGTYVAQAVSDQAHVAAEKLDSTVRQSPILSLAAAFGLGALVAVMFRRNS